MKKHEETNNGSKMKMQEGKMEGHFLRFGLMIALSFISMYVLM